MSTTGSLSIARVGQQSRRLTPVAVVGVTLLALCIRVYGLTSYGIWFDEAYHIQLVQLPTIGAMLTAVLSNPPSDPLYVLLLRPWAALFGTGDLAVRFLSVLFSTATVPAAYWLGCTLRSEFVGLVGAILLAVSPYAVELGQEAALYALASLTTTLALAAGWHWLRHNTRRSAFVYVAVAFTAIYSHYVVAVILALFVVTAPQTGSRRVTLRAWLIANTLVLAAWLAWLGLMTANWLSNTVPRTTLRHIATWDELGGALVQLSSGSSVLLTGARVPMTLGLLAGGALLIIACCLNSPPILGPYRALLLISTLVFMVPFLISSATGLWLFAPHFMVFLLPAIFVALAGGITRLANDFTNISRTRLALAGGLAALWVGSQVWGLALYYSHPPHGVDGLRELAGVLRSGVRSGDVVLVTPPAIMPPLRQYYGEEIHGLPSDFDLRVVYLPYEPERWYADSLRVLEQQTTGRQRIWLVYRPQLDDKGRMLATVQSRYHEGMHISYPYADLYLYTR